MSMPIAYRHHSFSNVRMIYGCLQILHKLPLIQSLMTTILRPLTVPQKSIHPFNWGVFLSFCKWICGLMANTPNKNSSTELIYIEGFAELNYGTIQHFGKYAYSFSCQELVCTGCLKPQGQKLQEGTTPGQEIVCLM